MSLETDVIDFINRIEKNNCDCMLEKIMLEAISSWNEWDGNNV